MFNLVSFVTYMLVTAITPGPANITSMSIGSRVGFKKGLPFNFGILAGAVFIAVLATFLFNSLGDIILKIKTPMLIIGAIYMLYIAWNIYRSTGELKENEASGGFMRGIMLQLVNPKYYIYILVSIEIYIMPAFHGKLPQLMFFALLLPFVGFSCTLLWSAFGSAFKTLFSKYAKITNMIMALLLVYCAISLFFE